MTQFSPEEQTYQSNDRITDDVHPLDRREAPGPPACAFASKINPLRLFNS